MKKQIKQLRHSEAIKGEKVTTHSECGAIGLGYLVDGTVYVTTGSVFAIDATQKPLPMVSFDRDSGAGYMDKVSRVTGGIYGREK